MANSNARQFRRSATLTRITSAYCLADSRFKKVGKSSLDTLAGTLSSAVHTVFEAPSSPVRCSLLQGTCLYSRTSHLSFCSIICRYGSIWVATVVGASCSLQMVVKVRLRRRDCIISLHEPMSTRVWLSGEKETCKDTVVDARGASVRRLMGAGSAADRVRWPCSRLKSLDFRAFVLEHLY